ncbi:putative esterase/lipase [Exidia glandulosa HHB12029]|uniref:Putative esterase/lipase n=1 Tax=Exidia glandulosa HHB12029 TaxID=1314781 RepID=A0A165KBY5_EXIGL|nr:putative esterase/lipase [Exidia glandulosa HHB12029]
MWPFTTYLWLKTVVSLMRFLTSLSKRGQPRVTTANSVIHIPSRDARRTIKVHVYTPNRGDTGPAPVLINLHGSGFVLPLHGTDDEFCRRVADETEYTVLDAQYRLAPEYPFPAALNDAEDVLRYVLNKPDTFARDRVVLCGFSAGANLALALASSGEEKLHAVLAFYPPTDLSVDPATKIPPEAGGQPIPAPMARLFDRCYIQKGTRSDDPRVSPSFAPTDSFPDKVFIVTGAYDTLAPETDLLAEKIAKVPGKTVVHRRYAKCNHAWDKEAQPGTEHFTAKQDAYALALGLLRD